MRERLRLLRWRKFTVPSASPQAATFESGDSASATGVPSSANCSMLAASMRSMNSAPLPAQTSSSRPRHCSCESATGCAARCFTALPSASNTRTSLPWAKASCLPSARHARPAGQRGDCARTREGAAGSAAFHSRTAPSCPLLARAIPFGCQASSSTPGACSPSATTPSAVTSAMRPSPPPTASVRPSGDHASATGKSSTAALPAATSRAAGRFMRGACTRTQRGTSLTPRSRGSRPAVPAGRARGR